MRIHLPAETWVEVFAWLNRREFAQKMEQLWDREFSTIAEKWLHEWSKGIKIDSLEYRKKEGAEQGELCKWEHRAFHFLKQLVPIAEVDMPKNIVSFKQIQISYLDNTILAFLRRIQPLLHNVHLSIESSWRPEEAIPIALDHLLPLFSGGEFESVKLREKEIALLNDSRHSSALLNTKVLTLHCTASTSFTFTWLYALLANWLFSKRAADGQPRMLVFPWPDYYYKNFVTILQKRFMAAATDEASPFIVHFKNWDPSGAFAGRTFQNVNNGQHLIVWKVNNNNNDDADVDVDAAVVVRWALPDENMLISCPLDFDHVERLVMVAEWRQKLADIDIPTEKFLQLMSSPKLGPLDPICPQQEQSHSGYLSSEEEVNAQEKPAAVGTSSNKEQNIVAEEKCAK